MVAFAGLVPRAEAAFNIKIITVDDLLFGLSDYDNMNMFPAGLFAHNGLSDPDKRVLIVGYSEFPDGRILPNIYGYALGDGSYSKLYVMGKGDESYTITELRAYVDTDEDGIFGGLNDDGSINLDSGDEPYSGGNAISINGVPGGLGPVGYYPGWTSIPLDSVEIDTSEAECDTDNDCVDDDVFCNGSPVCSSGECVDGNAPCRDDQTCDEDFDTCLDCQYDADCDNGDFCDGAEECFVGSCVAGAEPCDNDQTCNEGSDTCIDIVDPDCYNDSDCTDGVFCNGAEQCVSGECVDGDDPCDQDETCDEGSDTCVDIVVPDCDDNSDCDNGLFCDGAEQCVSGVCVVGDDPCDNDQTCNEGSDTCVGIVEPDCNDDSDCTDGVFCNGEETCFDGVCVAGDEPCDHDETCNEADEQCVPLPVNDCLAEISIKGSGSVEKFCNQDGDPVWIEVKGTTDRSSLTIKSKVKKRTVTLGDLDIDGSIKDIKAKDVFLTGELVVNGGIGKLSMLGTESSSVIAASWIGKASFAGDFEGSMILEGNGSPPKGLTLGKLTVKQSLSDAWLIVSGNVGSVKVGYWGAGSTLAVGVEPGNDGKFFTDDDASTGGLLGKVKYKAKATDNNGEAFGIIADDLSDKFKTRPLFYDVDFHIWER